jgi:Type IV pili methyl-accepting chemotaxis transducer N-term
LRDVAELWNEFGVAVKSVGDSIAGGTAHPGIAGVYDLNLPVMLQMDTVVSLIEAESDDLALLRPGLANAINVAGRQRLLSQKMSKELCMIASNHDAELSRASLLGTVALFLSSRTELVSRLGELKLSPEQNARFLAQYSTIDAAWAKLDAVMTKVIAGAAPSHDDLVYVADHSLSLLVELEAAVKLYRSVE